MSFQLSPEQAEFKESLRRFLTAELSSKYLRQRIASDSSHDQTLLKKIAELGLFSFFSAQDEEVGGAFETLALISGEMGRALCPEALLESIFSGPYLFFQVLDDSTRKAFLSMFGNSLPHDLAQGAARFGIAEAVRLGNQDISLTSNGAQNYLHGTVDFVPCLDILSGLLVSCSDSEEKLAVIDAASCRKSGALKVVPQKTLDGTVKLFSAALNHAPCMILPHAAASRMRTGLMLLKACEISGACERVVEITRDYVCTRKQFAVPVGGFQAVQHGLAEMHLQSESLASLAGFGAWALENSKEQAEMASQAAIMYACEVGPLIVEKAIQFHGGIGFTWEYDLHLYLRRVRSSAALFSPNEAAQTDFLRLLSRAGA